MKGGQGLWGHLTGGWGISGTSIFQSGYPIMVWNTNSFQPLCSNPNVKCPSVGNKIVGFAPNSGDYNADGDSAGVAGVGLDYPNINSYTQGTSKAAFLSGAFSAGQFSAPSLGSEGNEKPNPFRAPNFAETDVNFYKNSHITERVVLQLRFEFFNLFNRVNLTSLDQNLPDGNFGKATAQQLPRNWQIGGRLTF
jgi:hypothetical protein